MIPDVVQLFLHSKVLGEMLSAHVFLLGLQVHEGCNLRAIKTLFILLAKNRSQAERIAAEEDLLHTYVDTLQCRACVPWSPYLCVFA